VKTTVLLGLVASLVGGIAAPVAVKADASINVAVQAKASLSGSVMGEAQSTPKTMEKRMAESKAVAKTRATAGNAKGKGSMKTSINEKKKSDGKKASALPGE
jgi:hypothetical protein